MQNKNYNKAKMLTAAAMLSSALLCSCAASRAEKNRAKDLEPKQDSVDVFVPTHPPVVVKKTWREVMNE